MGDATHEGEKLAIAGLADRIRDVMRARNMTLQDLSDKARLPKRSLENYLRSNDPQVPGLEAAAKIAAALHVSLDWLVLSEGKYPENTARLTEVAARAAALPYLEDMVKYHRSGATVIGDETVLGFTPQGLAKAIGESAATRARSIASLGGAHDSVEVALRTMDAVMRGE
jgi:transcriptional regulator with XRE-family HTH domain